MLLISHEAYHFFADFLLWGDSQAPGAFFWGPGLRGILFHVGLFLGLLYAVAVALLRDHRISEPNPG